MLIDNPLGNYRFVSGIAPYSCGVTAAPGYEIIHVTLRRPVRYRTGFDQIARHLAEAERPKQALCGIELRLPAPLSFDGFVTFNAEYRLLLADWGLLLDSRNPVARTNVAPILHPPTEPSLYGFSYTVPASGSATPTFIVAGAGDLHDQAAMDPSAIVRPGETSAAALREKAGVVMVEMQTRLSGLGVTWTDATTINLYTVYPIKPFLTDTILSRIGETVVHGVHWHLSHPPIAGLAFEMDVRGVRNEIWL